MAAAKLVFLRRNRVGLVQIGARYQMLALRRPPNVHKVYSRNDVIKNVIKHVINDVIFSFSGVLFGSLAVELIPGYHGGKKWRHVIH